MMAFFSPRSRSLPAVQRMEAAMRTLATWKAQGLAPRIEWEPHVQIVSAAGAPLQHPAGCLMECLFVLRDEHPYQDDGVADSVNRRLALDQQMAQMPRRGPGGAS